MFQSTLRVIFNNIKVNIPDVLRKKQVIAPLGRWCHKDYNEKCNTDIKADLANLDNGCIVNNNNKLIS